ncbi:MAG: hypothetical protein HUJ63_06555, partial [Enterococcus sp.]|nr:hypothetical protein [Enterococcus sp.]
LRDILGKRHRASEQQDQHYGKTFHFWSPMLYVKTLLVAVSWRDKYTEAMSAHGYEEGATRSRKEHFVSAKVSLGLAILIIIFTNLFIFLT